MGRTICKLAKPGRAFVIIVGCQLLRYKVFNLVVLRESGNDDKGEDS